MSDDRCNCLQTVTNFAQHGRHAYRCLSNPAWAPPPPPILPPYTTDPTKLAKAENGFRYCDDCDQPVPVAGHECAKPVGPGDDHCADCGQSLWFMGANGVWECGSECDGCLNLALLDDVATGREFAESLLCAIFFSIQQRIDAGQQWSDAAGIVLGDVIDIVRDE